MGFRRRPGPRTALSTRVAGLRGRRSGHRAAPRDAVPASATGRARDERLIVHINFDRRGLRAMPRVDPGRGGLRCNGSSRNAVRRWRRVTVGAYGGGGGWGDEPAGRGAGNAEDGIGRVPGMERRWQPVLSFGDLEPGRRLRRAKGFPDCVGQVLPERRESVDAGAARGVRQKSGADDRGRLPRYSMGTDLPPPLPRGIASLVRGADGDWLHSARKPGSWRSWSTRSGKGPRGRTGWAGGRAVRTSPGPVADSDIWRP